VIVTALDVNEILPVSDIVIVTALDVNEILPVSDIVIVTALDVNEILSLLWPPPHNILLKFCQFGTLT
jgi:hypothetical protein